MRKKKVYLVFCTSDEGSDLKVSQGHPTVTAAKKWIADNQKFYVRQLWHEKFSY